MPFIQVKPVLQSDIIRLCVKPYPGHPRGCPNFNKKISCPPHMPIYNFMFDTHKNVFAVYNVFDLEQHVNKMKQKHPNWSWRQLVNCLYWQGPARRQLKDEIGAFLLTRTHPQIFDITTCPEAMGVNVTQTMRQVGIELEWPPIHKAYQVALAGVNL